MDHRASVELYSIIVRVRHAGNGAADNLRVAVDIVGLVRMRSPRVSTFAVFAKYYQFAMNFGREPATPTTSVDQ